MLDEKSVAAFLENGTLAGYDGISFPGLAELLNGKTPANSVTDDDDFDDDVDRDEYRPATASMDNFKATAVYTPGQFTDVSSPVSYTHLDVYKRQTPSTSIFGAPRTRAS